MYRKSVLIIVVLAIMVGCGFKNRKGYYYDNQRFNYVRLEKFKGAGDKNINHPFQFTDPQMSTILKMIEIKKGVFASKSEKIKNVFDSYAIGKLTPPIIKAFSEVTPDQKVGFAFMIKDPMFVIKNDRLSTGSMWVEDGKLHIDFDEIYVKVTGDTDKRGYIAMRRQVQSARGLRIALDLQPGQEYGDSTHELVVDVGLSAQIAEERLKKEKELAAKGVEDTVKIEVVKDKSVRERLRELKTLRKEQMITEEEYQQKKKELLDQL